MAFSSCDKTVQGKVNHVIFFEYHTTVAFDICFIMMAYLGILSWIWKLNISVLHCLSQSIDMITSTAVCQHVCRPVQVLITHYHLLLHSKYLELHQYCMKSTVDTQLLNMLHSYQQLTAAIYLYQCLCHVTQRNISIHFVLLATAGHTAAIETKQSTKCLQEAACSF